MTSTCPYCDYPNMCHIVTDKLVNLKTDSTHFFYFYYSCQRLFNVESNPNELVIITKYIKKIADLFHDITSENESSILHQMQNVRDLSQSELLSIYSQIKVRELLYNDNKDCVCAFGGGSWTKEELDNYF
jgi:hypothetical protein